MKCIPRSHCFWSLLACAGALSLAMAAPAQAGLITVFGTGVDSSGNTLTGGAADTHYSLSRDGVAATAYQWQGNPLGWINIGNNTGISGANPIDPRRTFHRYVYTTTFDLAGFDASTASLVGKLYADDDVRVYLNGVYKTGFTTAYNATHDFTLGSSFVAGVNTLRFEVDNFNGYTGFSTGFSLATANSLAPSGVPEPGALALVGLGLASVGVGRLRRAARLS